MQVCTLLYIESKNLLIFAKLGTGSYLIDWRNSRLTRSEDFWAYRLKKRWCTMPAFPAVVPVWHEAMALGHIKMWAIANIPTQKGHEGKTTLTELDCPDTVQQSGHREGRPAVMSLPWTLTGRYFYSAPGTQCHLEPGWSLRIARRHQCY